MIRWREQWPWLLLVALVVAAYIDLRVDVVRLETEVELLRQEPTASAPRDPRPAPTRPDAGPPPEEWTCAGAIAPDLVRTAVGEQGPAVFTCYEQRAREEPDLEGLLIVEVKVGPRGAVEAVRVGGPLRDGPLVRCVADAAESWRFPPPVGGDCAIVSAPFRLAPDSAQAPQ